MNELMKWMINLVTGRSHGAHDEGVANVFEENRTDAEDDVGEGDDHEEDEPKPNDYKLI